MCKWNKTVLVLSFCKMFHLEPTATFFSNIRSQDFFIELKQKWSNPQAVMCYATYAIISSKR